MGKSLDDKKIINFYNVGVKDKLNVLLVCGVGASSGLMAAKMRLEARNRNLDINFVARSESEINSFVGDVDAIMIGPHFSLYYEELKENYGQDTVIVLMDKDYYSILDGNKAIDHLLQELQNSSPTQCKNQDEE